MYSNYSNQNDINTYNLVMIHVHRHKLDKLLILSSGKREAECAVNKNTIIMYPRIYALDYSQLKYQYLN